MINESVNRANITTAEEVTNKMNVKASDRSRDPTEELGRPFNSNFREKKRKFIII